MTPEEMEMRIRVTRRWMAFMDEILSGDLTLAESKHDKFMDSLSEEERECLHSEMIDMMLNVTIKKD